MGKRQVWKVSAGDFSVICESPNVPEWIRFMVEFGHVPMIERWTA